MVKQTSASRGMSKTVGRTSHHKELNRILREHPGRSPTTPPHPPSYCQLLPFNALTMVDISAIADDGSFGTRPSRPPIIVVFWSHRSSYRYHSPRDRLESKMGRRGSARPLLEKAISSESRASIIAQRWP